jgi:hypothetical protein
MIGYQPNFRPVVRAQMAQAAPSGAAPSAAPAQPPSVKVPVDVADQTAAALAAAKSTRTVALIASGLGILGGGAAVYCGYMKGKKKVDTTVVAAGVFAFINVVLFGYVVTK